MGWELEDGKDWEFLRSFYVRLKIADACADQIRGKVVLTTGVSPGGLGAFFLQLIAKYEPKLLILAARDISKAQTTAETIAAASPGAKTRLLQLDLSSQEQIRRAAREVNAYREPIDVLVNNAGLMACPYSTTQDGLEMQFGSMHIGHFLFTNLIMGKILAAGDGARVVSVSSDGYRLGPVRFNDWSFEHGQTYNKWRAYGQAKTANMLFAVSLAEKLGNKGLIASSLHPGVIATNLSRHTSDSGFAELREQPSSPPCLLQEFPVNHACLRQRLLTGNWETNKADGKVSPSKQPPKA
ncbi:hypothetical protein MMC22_003802 [Lobaria immixta]|nr:hypothetical protein [Lobaria immixta]